MQPLSTSLSHRSPHSSKSHIVHKSCCPGRKAPGNQWQRGTGLSESAWERHQTQETNPLLLSQCQPAPPGGRSQGLHVPHLRWSQPEQGLHQPLHFQTGCCLLPRCPTGTPTQCEPLPGAQPVSVGQSRGHAGIQPQRGPTSTAKQLCCAHPSPTPMWGQPSLGLQHSPAGAGREPSTAGGARTPCRHPDGYF